MRREEFIARVLGRILEAGALHCAQDGGRPVHYEELPAAVETTLAATLGIDPHAADRRAMAEVLAMDAKTPQLPFEPDSERKQREAPAALRDAVLQFANAPYRALEALRTMRASADQTRGRSPARYSATR